MLLIPVTMRGINVISYAKALFVGSVAATVEKWLGKPLLSATPTPAVITKWSIYWSAHTVATPIAADWLAHATLMFSKKSTTSNLN